MAADQWLAPGDRRWSGRPRRAVARCPCTVEPGHQKLRCRSEISRQAGMVSERKSWGLGSFSIHTWLSSEINCATSDPSRVPIRVPIPSNPAARGSSATTSRIGPWTHVLPGSSHFLWTPSDTGEHVRSSVGFLDTQEVTGSSPVGPTTENPRRFLGFSHVPGSDRQCPTFQGGGRTWPGTRQGVLLALGYGEAPWPSGASLMATSPGGAKRVGHPWMGRDGRSDLPLSASADSNL